MDTKSVPERMDRLERVVQILAEDQVSLQKLIANLATETDKGFALVAARSAETDRRIAETDRRIAETDRRIAETERQWAETGRQMRETDERFRKTDECIEKLVIAIGKLMSSKN